MSEKTSKTKPPKHILEGIEKNPKNQIITNRKEYLDAKKSRVQKPFFICVSSALVWHWNLVKEQRSQMGRERVRLEGMILLLPKNSNVVFNSDFQNRHENLPSTAVSWTSFAKTIKIKFKKFAALATAARIKVHGLYVPASKQAERAHDTYDLFLPDNNKSIPSGIKIAEEIRIQESLRLLIRLRRGEVWKVMSKNNLPSYLEIKVYLN